jgi:hypothetical protein
MSVLPPGADMSMTGGFAPEAAIQQLISFSLFPYQSADCLHFLNFLISQRRIIRSIVLVKQRLPDRRLPSFPSF